MEFNSAFKGLIGGGGGGGVGVSAKEMMSLQYFCMFIFGY